MTVPYIPKGMSTNAAPLGMMSIPEAAGAANDVVKQVMRVEPTVAGMAGMFVPGLSVVQPWIMIFVPFLERELDAISLGNNGDILAGILELIQRLSNGRPSAAAPTPNPLGSELGSSSLDPASQGSA